MGRFRKNKKTNKFYILLTLLLVVTVGYALISTTLNINGIAGINSNTWNVHWENVVPNQASTRMAEDPVISENATKVTYEVNLGLPGDFYEFEVDAKNDGTVPSRISKIIHTIYESDGETTTQLPECIISSITYKDTTKSPKVNDILAPGEKETYVVRIEYDINSEQQIHQATSYIIEDEIEYEQINKNNLYTISFDTNDGGEDITKTIEKTNTVGDLPIPPEREGYEFDGWYTEVDGGTKITDEIVPNEDTTYYAHWNEVEATFDIGKTVITKLKTLAGDTLSPTNPWTTSNTSITAIQRTNTKPNISEMTDTNIISEEGSTPIYAWYDDGTIYWWTTAIRSRLNSDSSYMFGRLNSLITINLNDYIFDDVVDMSYFLYASHVPTIDLRDKDLSKVKYLSNTFSGMSTTTINLSGMDLSNVTNISSIFGGTRATTINLSGVNFSGVTTVPSAFGSATIDTLDLSNTDFSNTTSMSYMFGGTNVTNIDFTGIDTSSLQNVSGMFSSSRFTELDLSSFDTSNINNISSIFGGTNVTKIDMSNWDFSGLTSLDSLFNTGISNLETIVMDNVNTSTIIDMNNMFAGCSGIKTLDLSDFDVSNVENMNYMLARCSSLESIDMTGWNPTKLTTVVYMFQNCTSLTSMDLSNWNTPSLQNVSSLFYGCTSLTSLNLSGWNTRNVTSMSSLVLGCTQLQTLNLSGWDFRNCNGITMMSITNGGINALKTLIFDNVIFAQNSNFFFGGLSSVERISLNNVNTLSVTDLGSMFNGCSSLISIDLRDFNTSKVTNMSTMFYGCSSLTELDLSNFDTSKVISFGSLLSGCNSLVTLDMSNFDFRNCNGITMMSITNGGVNALKTLIMDNVIFAPNTGSFFGSLRNVEEISLRNVDTSNVTSMVGTFNNCSSLTELDLSSFDTSKVTSMTAMFTYASNLTTIYVSDKFVVDQVTESGGMFDGATSLVGGAGTIYDANHVNKEYAHYDRGTSDPGYFNEKSFSNMNKITLQTDETIYRELYIPSNSEIGTLPIPTKNNYRFQGWYTEITGGIKVEKNYIPTGNITIYARWQIIPEHTITFNPNGGVVSETTRTIKDTQTIGTLPTPTRENYLFQGWYTEITGGIQVATTYIPDNDTILYARWREKKNYTITFNPNGGVVSETTRIVQETSSIGELPQAEREGYVVEGWYTGLTTGTKVTSTYVPSNNMTLYARWVPNKTIVYNANQGQFPNGETTNVINYRYSATNTTQYAHTPNIDDNGTVNGTYASGLTQTTTVTLEGAPAIKIDVWYSTQGTSYDWLAIYPKNVIPSTSNYSQATISNGKLGGGYYTTKPINESYHKVYIVNDDTAKFYFRSDSSGNYYGYYAVITPLTSKTGEYMEPDREDYIFTGWNENNTATVPQYTTEEDILDNIYDLNNNETLYATYRLGKKSTITFNPNGGEIEEATRQVTETKKIGELPIPTREGYTFIGWYTEISGGIVIDKDYIPTENTTLYAQWSRSTEFTFDANGGRFSNNEETNVIDYTYIPSGISIYSHTQNVTNSGTNSTTYAPNSDINDVVTIPGVKGLDIEVWYSTEGTSYDWLAIYPEGVTPTSTNYSQATISNGKLGGGSYTTKPTSESYHRKYKVIGNTAQFYFHSDASGNYYGYYAIIKPAVTGIDNYQEPVKDNYQFAGWNTKQDGSGYSYKDEEEVKNDAYYLSPSTTLYAQWKNIEYTITFDPNGGTVTPTTKTVVENSPIGTLPTPTKSGNEFVGWYTGLTDGEKIDENYIVNNNQRIYAHWDYGATLKPGPVINNMIINMVEEAYSYESLNDYINYNCYPHDTEEDKINCINEYIGLYYDGRKPGGKIRSIKKATESQYNSIKNTLTDSNLISLSTKKSEYTKYHIATSMAEYNSEYKDYEKDNIDSTPVYMWFNKDNQTLYYYSESNKIYLNEKSRAMFASFYNLEDCDLSGFNTENVEDMSYMFTSTRVDDIDFSTFNTSNVINMEGAFTDSTYDTLDLSIWDTSSVQKVDGIFANIVYQDYDLYGGSDIVKQKMNHNTINISNWDFSNLSNKQNIFSAYHGSSSGYGDVGVPEARTRSLILDNAIFGRYAPMLSYSAGWDFVDKLNNISLKNVDTTQTVDMSSMFYEITAKTLDLSSFDTSKVTDMSYMFAESVLLKTIYVSDNFVTTNVTSSMSMFEDNYDIVGQLGTIYDSTHIDKAYAHIDEGTTNPGYFTAKTGWRYINANDNPSLTDQQWTYYINGTQILEGFHTINDLYGTPQKYFFINGMIHLGWLHYNGNYYYLSTEDDDGNGYVNAGAYRSETKTIDGVSYTFDSSGRCTNYSGTDFNTIVFNPNGGNITKNSINVNTSTAIQTLPTPTRSGYTFDGWYTGLTDGTQITSAYIPTSDITLYAHWTPTN